PSVSGTVDTEIYIYYTTTVTADGAEPESVWDENYVMVQHMKDNTTSATLDSTGNNNDGAKGSANNPLEADGKIGKGQDFDATAEYINISDNASLELGNKITIEAWIYPDSIANGTRRQIITKRDSSSDYCTFELWLRYVTGESANKRLEAGFAKSGPGWIGSARGGSVNTGEWNYVGITHDASISGSINFLINGTVIESDDDDTGTGTRLDNAEPIRIGYPGFDYALDGKIDEIRISNVIRSASWIKASYESGNGTLLACGDEEALP
ncbi:MAG: LamG domain-containing protein, partial [Candidatus Paceibacterota bacterium]